MHRALAKVLVEDKTLGSLAAIKSPARLHASVKVASFGNQLDGDAVSRDHLPEIDGAYVHRKVLLSAWFRNSEHNVHHVNSRPAGLVVALGYWEDSLLCAMCAKPSRSHLTKHRALVGPQGDSAAVVIFV